MYVSVCQRKSLRVYICLYASIYAHLYLQVMTLHATEKGRGGLKDAQASLGGVGEDVTSEDIVVGKKLWFEEGLGCR